MSPSDLPAPPDHVLVSDHLFAAWLADRAGELLLDVRLTGLTGKDLKDAGDLASHELLMALLALHRPDDAILSEEEHRGTSGLHDRLSANRVWIIDPVDGTREYSEPPRDDWAVHVALWKSAGVGPADLAAGAVALPALGSTFHTAGRFVVPTKRDARPRIAVSRTRPPEFIAELAAHLDAELVPMGSAGAKVISVVRDVTDIYIHAGGQYEWDSAAPVAVARAAGLFTSRIDGTDLRYNQEEVLLPDLLVCREDLAKPILDFVSERGIS